MKYIFENETYQKRFDKHLDELKWLYMELYDNEEMFAELCEEMYRFFDERSLELKKMDEKRAANPEWYRKNDMMGMMLYIDNFADNLKGLKEKIDILKPVM